MKRLAILFAMSFLNTTGAMADSKLVTVTSGTLGDLQSSRLYSVDYTCSANGSVGDFIANAQGLFHGVTSSGTINESVTIISSDAATPPVVADAAAASPPAPAPQPSGNTVFRINAMMITYSGAISHDLHGGTCSGQFFLSGKNNYRIEAAIGTNTKDTFADLVSKGAALVKSAATSMYALFRVTKPVEFDNNVQQAQDILTDYKAFADIFQVEDKKRQFDDNNLRVGRNWVTTYDQYGRVMSSVLFNVRPIVSLVIDGHSKFLDAYKEFSSTAALKVTGDAAAMRDQCDTEIQPYLTAGIRDNRDIAYLLYRRLLLVPTSSQDIAYCMGTEVANAALSLLRTKPDILPMLTKYKVTPADIKNIPILHPSDQPHNRPSLETDVSDLLYLLGRHLQSKGLRGSERDDLLHYFAPSVDVQDQTNDYKALALLFPEVIDQTGKTTDGPGLLDALRKAGIDRWLCVQRTKKQIAGSTIPIYDSKIDSAVMVIAAKASKDEKLDKNKTALFGVHLKFKEASNNDPLVINEMIFEERYRDIVITANSCITDTAKEPKSPPAQPAQTAQR